MKNMIEIEMVQGFTKNGDLITHVSKEYQFIKYGSGIPLGVIVRPIAKFKIKCKLPKKRFLESESGHTKRIENWFYSNLEIYQVHL